MYTSFSPGAPRSRSRRARGGPHTVEGEEVAVPDADPTVEATHTFDEEEVAAVDADPTVEAKHTFDGEDVAVVDGAETGGEAEGAKALPENAMEEASGTEGPTARPALSTRGPGPRCSGWARKARQAHSAKTRHNSLGHCSEPAVLDELPVRPTSVTREVLWGSGPW